MTKKKEKGVLILALGHQYYGRMALNLAMSIRFTSQLPITLAYTPSAIGQIAGNLSFFDNTIEIPESYYTRKGVYKEFIKAKTNLYNLSPYHETLYLDADTLWLPRRSVDVVFEELSDIDLAIQCKGVTKIGDHNGKSYWCDLSQYKEVYNTDKYYNFASEFIYFKKNKANQKFFSDAVKIYDNLKIGYTTFSGGIPDELIFNIAMVQNKIEPFREFYVPIYWEQSERKNMKPSQMYQEYYGYSAGGKLSSTLEKRFYDNLAQFYGTHFGVQHYKLKDKMKFLPERTHI